MKRDHFAVRLGVKQAVRCVTAMVKLGTIATFICCSACSGEKGIPVSGDVTLNGKPIPAGTIAFESVDGKGRAAAGKITEGKYSLTGSAAPLVGAKKVRISGVFKTGRRVPAGPPTPPGTMVDEIGDCVPETYNTKTILTCEVVENGQKPIDFHLSRPK